MRTELLLLAGCYIEERQIKTESARNCKKWLASCPEFFQHPFNAVLMRAWIETQVGSDRVWTEENFAAAHPNVTGFRQ
jgi:hypothetical protein